MRHLALIAAVASLASACAHAPTASVAAPDFSPIVSESAPAHARLYADCFRQAADTGSYRRASDGGGDELLLFTCTGTPAKAFYDALGPWSAEIGSAFEQGGRTYRSTAQVVANMFGVDSCSALDGADHRCIITFNAGDFLDE
ncbi:hypothetical protein GGQ87_002771 [Brevundimonas alba]|uniref:Lipoprotein n=1 Tax=Brevundimonas alba TaxID=74314 RepID=A0A7X5YM49_9CAUL|nr:hypothetical protein [Brevundimonas alba]NJC42476.1 hypothetical protein [Brevundimonas alba]